MGVKPAKNRLLEFYHRHKGTPSFEIQPGPPPPALPRFLCTVTVPGIDCKDGAYQTQVRQCDLYWAVFHVCLPARSGSRLRL